MTHLGALTGHGAPALADITLIISIGRMARPQGERAPPSGVYQGCGSVMRSSFSASENG